MATARKRKCRSMNELPDSILGDILSFLDTRDAVRTSILSTRWKHLYAAVPNLHVCDTFIRRDSHKKSLINFIDKVLHVHRLAPLERFHLLCDKEEASFTSSQVSSWICSALRCKVEKLTLGSVKGGLMRLPQHLFHCESLVSLELNDEIKLDIPNKIQLPKLRSVCLRRIEIVNYPSFERFITCLHALEELVMEECWLELENTLRIFSPKLVKLTINKMRNYASFIKGAKVVIKAASLVYLNITNAIDSPAYSLSYLASLNEAHLDIHAFSNEVAAALHRNIREISHVRSLHLSESTLKALSRLPGVVLPIFERLRMLKLHATCTSTNNCAVLRQLVMKARVLETLIFEGSIACWYPEGEAPSCVNTLKDIICRPTAVGDNELKTVEYFLKNADVLEKLVLHLPDERNQMMIAEKLLSFCRGSKNCVVMLHD